MLFAARVQDIMWALYAVTAFTGLASAFPQPLLGNGLTRRANEEKAGLGVELELGKVTIEGKKNIKPEERQSVKGAKIIPLNFKPPPMTNWVLTAEVTADDTLRIYTEAIVDGTKNKVGDHKTSSIGEEVFKYFDAWAPCSKSKCMVQIEGHDNLGPWEVKWPADPPKVETLKFDPQVTTAVPMEGIQKLLADWKTKVPSDKNALVGSPGSNAKELKILRQDDFKSFTKIKPSDVDAEFLGAFTLLTAYATLAHTSNKQDGPKKIIPIMPRTDFVTLYSKYVEPKIKSQLGDKTTLLQIVQKISGQKGDIAKQVFTWTGNDKATKPKENWDGRDADLKSGKLEVQKFLGHLQGDDKGANKLDLVKLMDKTLRNGQIGGLGDKLEQTGTNKVAPLFELRELAPIQGADLGKKLGEFEDKVIAYYAGKFDNN
ncbi:hypothetical protein BT63DRAFT_480344 [Microthyrium microscopicum]|uniref:Uncharacterized protein n=1 Tax=Microthyrium microscopicum TaxID=703497 RepID=A0A6A6U6T2_9PEZI|nr:hypothetical protein BT63DRAFT_480344 [Microthyrium microscopicum]